MTFCWFLRLVGVGLEVLAYFDARHWAEQKALAIKDMLPIVTGGLVVVGQWLWKAFLVGAGTIAVLGLLVRCTIGGFGPEADPVLNVIAFPFAAVGTGMLIAFVLAVIVGAAYVLLEVLAQTPRGLLASVGMVCLVLSFLINCQ